MYIIYSIRHLSTFVNSQLFSLDSRLFSLDSRLFCLDSRLFLSTLDFFPRHSILVSFFWNYKVEWLRFARMKNGLNKYHKWQYWMGGSWKWRCKIYIGVPPHLSMIVEYTLGWHFRDWFRSGFVLNFQGFLLQRRCIFPKRRSFFYTGKWYYSRKMFVFPRNMRVFSRKSDTFYGQATCFCGKWLAPSTVVFID